MRTWKTVTVAILAIAVVVLTTTSVFAFMGRPGYYTPYSTPAGTTGTYVTYPSGTTTYGGYYGRMMGGGWGCGGMRGRFSYGAPIYTNPAVATQLNITTAATIAQNYLTSTGNINLEVSEVEEYTLNFYVIVKEKDTGMGAFELLVDKYTGAISPEMGPNIMWNTKYGMHNGIMGWLTGTSTAQATVTAGQAKANAQQYLNVYYPGTTAGDTEAFYGYYHVEVLSSGNIYGMLSVNSYTGQVWYHTWHGAFVQEIEFS
jgi:hypothetical protein